jgi:putative ABC transport system permease protein
MIRPPRWHLPTIVGRLRADARLLVLTGLVVALTTLLTAVVAPVSDRAADRAIVAAVSDAGLGGSVVATAPRDPYAPIATVREPRAPQQLRKVIAQAQSELPPGLAAVLQPGIATVATPSLHLLDRGPGRSLRLTYAGTQTGSPAVTYVAGRAPRSSAPADRPHLALSPDAAPWPVQVAVSPPVARGLGIGPGDRLPAEDDDHNPIRIRVSGVFVPADPQDPAWRLAPDLLEPTRGVSEGLELTTGGALVTPVSLPDLQLAVHTDELAQHVTFLTRPSAVRWRDTDALAGEVAHLQAADVAGSDLRWDSALGGVLADGRAQVVAAQGQAQVVLVGLVLAALLVLVLAAQLLVSRRAGPITIARERGESLPDIAGELVVEALLVTAIGSALGLAAAWLLAGDVGWAWSVPVFIVAVVASPALGAVLAARSTSVRRAPANRSARRSLDRARRARRLAVEVTVLAAAALSVAALRQRGVAQESGWGGVTAAAAPALCAFAGTLIAVRLLHPALRLGLSATRRSTHDVALLVTARLSQTAVRALPVLAVSVAVAQLTFGVALVATEHHGQESGALLAVGGDARLTAAPDRSVEAIARKVADAPGVRAAVSARVADDVRLVSRRTAAPVRLVVVDAADYQRLLSDSPLPDAPELARLGGGMGTQVPALLLGGSRDLRDDPTLQWQDATVRLDVVGDAPRVEASVAPVVVVDAAAFARAGASAPPNTVWAVGPGAAKALLASEAASGTVTTYADELDARRHAALPTALVRLAAAASVPLLLFAILGVVLAAAAEAPTRDQSLGRLRALGMTDRDLRRVLGGEVLTTVTFATVLGLALGLGGIVVTFGSLSLERITGQTVTPDVVVPWWIPICAAVVVLSALAVALSEWRRLQRRVLAELLRS